MNATTAAFLRELDGVQESRTPCPVCGEHLWLMMNIYNDGDIFVCDSLVATPLVDDKYDSIYQDDTCCACDECLGCGTAIS